MTTPNTNGPSDEIERYDPDIDPYRPVENGNYVRHSDALAALSRAREDARREALEEAAKVCDARRAEWARLHPEIGGERVHAFDAGVLSASNTCAERIRALIPNTPQGETKPQASPAVKALVEVAKLHHQCATVRDDGTCDGCHLSAAIAAVEKEIG